MLKEKNKEKTYTESNFNCVMKSTQGKLPAYLGYDYLHRKKKY